MAEHDNVPTECPDCRGLGWRWEKAWGPLGMMRGKFPCVPCNGTGRIANGGRESGSS